MSIAWQAESDEESLTNSEALGLLKEFQEKVEWTRQSAVAAELDRTPASRAAFQMSPNVRTLMYETKDWFNRVPQPTTVADASARAAIVEGRQVLESLGCTPVQAVSLINSLPPNVGQIAALADCMSMKVESMQQLENINDVLQKIALLSDSAEEAKADSRKGESEEPVAVVSSNEEDMNEQQD